jgi:FdhE protein
VASVSRIGADTSGTRYLHCALCQTEWHMVRIKCTHCESTKGITYQELESASGEALAATMAPKGSVRAECCDECGHYLKIVSMDKDPHVDPVADDLATVALDLLVSEAGKVRHGINYMLLWGEPTDESQVLEHSHAGAP